MERSDKASKLVLLKNYIGGERVKEEATFC